jgi:asparagine N-glycosylation enzyme membrane subunit Stt3
MWKRMVMFLKFMIIFVIILLILAFIFHEHKDYHDNLCDYIINTSIYISRTRC